MICDIRPAHAGDAEDISRVIICALRETNGKDYAPEIIALLEGHFSPAAVKLLMERRDVFVGLIQGSIVGTASLEVQTVHTVFVSPDAQGQGIGRLLMRTVETLARERQIAVLRLSSSITAEKFYARLGFEAVRDAYYGDERTILMERVLMPL